MTADALAQLPNDWDGLGALPITSAALDVMRRLTSDATATANGGIVFSRYFPGKEIEVEILADGSLEYLIDDGGNVTEGKGTETEILALLAEAGRVN